MAVLEAGEVTASTRRTARPLRWWRAPVAALAGLALVAAFPPYDLWWLAPVAVAVLALACHGRGLWAGAGIGAAFGAVFFSVLLQWTNMHTGALPWLLLSALQTAYLAALGAATTWISPLLARRRWLWAPATGLLWTLQEALRDRTPFGGFPWARLAFSQADSPLLPLASLGGAPLVTFATALAGGFLAAAVVARPRLTRAGALVAAGVAVVLAGLLVPLRAPTGRQVTVAIVQGNVPRLGLDFNAQRRAVLDNHVDGTIRLAARVAAGTARQPDLVIWPENSSDIDPLINRDAADRIRQAATAIRAPILVGAVLEDPDSDGVLNAGLVWLPEAGPTDRYVKRHPVPFAEYVPMRRVARLVTDKVDLVRADFVRGDRPGVLTLGPATIGDVICFEVAYDEVVRDTVVNGAQLLVVQTNNATFDEAEARQQMAKVRLRAVEHGRHALMASTVGVSGFVDERGTVYRSTGFNTPAVVVRELTLGSHRTLATTVGPAPEYLLVIASIALLLAAVPLRRRRPAPDGADDADDVADDERDESA